ncbi:probable glucosamine 6-phosphate N-acetyltransferase [Cephus cinctus]|uniref:Glucosamine 6-phosphate N-acetyltransferase n=1 Tax=Cephus cinctus TaxID=211228 RepID=A0AAJ7W2F1_CEPCN|nr:probable glucosamine 6-phosphate N-acetyltransferase [Cephus cinctus]XP_024942019.1 probable glucosamine 6-phosphate N-acetyltransferase [Cephus cinctus]
MAVPHVGNNLLEELDLFSKNLLDRLSDSKDNDLIIRPLSVKDYNKGFIQLLGQLTEVGNISHEQFLNTFRKMKMAGDYYIVVVEDMNTGKVIGSSTLVVEQKFIHNCALRGKLEDVVVSNEYRGRQLGKLLVNTISKLARNLRCYKLSLDCRDNLIPFYESLGFKRELGNANHLNARFHYENPTEQSHL